MRIGDKIANFTRSVVGLSLIAILTGIAVPAAAPRSPPAATQSPQPLPAAPVPPPPPGPVGLWIDHTGRGAVEIAPCGDTLCGRIVWMKEPNDKTGKPLLDSQNEDKSRRGLPICGLQIIGGLKQQSDGSWDKGWIYDPEQGSAFDVELRLRNPETLQVKGYLGVKFLSETYVWRRAKELPPKCPGI